MAINVRVLYSTKVYVIVYIDDGTKMRYNDDGALEDIIERTGTTIVKHNFLSADICSRETGELLATVERT